RMARYWRSSLGVLVCISGVGFALAYGLPAIYEAAAQIEVASAGGPQQPGKPTAIDEVASLVKDFTRLQKLIHDSPMQSPLRAFTPETLARAVAATATSENSIRLAFQANHAEAARAGCAAFADAVVAYFSKDSRNTARAELEQHTKELADFVNAHPDVLLE